MWAIIAIILLIALAARYVLMETSAKQAQAQIEAKTALEQQVATAGAQVLGVCVGVTTPGLYTAAELMGASFPASTAAGPSFVCLVRAGGSLPTGNAALVFLDGPATRLTGAVGSAASADVLQTAFAGGVAALWRQQIAGTTGSGSARYPDSVAGLVMKGSATPMLKTLASDDAEISLAGLLSANYPYTTPVVAAGLLSSSW